MSRPVQVAIIVAVALVGFAGAFVAFGGGSEMPPAGPVPATTAPGQRDAAADAEVAAQLGCRAPARRDPAYEAQLETQPDPPAAEGTTFHVLVTRDAQPVAGARVCLSAAMTDMAHGGASDEAREAAPGRYDASLTFPMRGPWTGTVKVIEPGQPAVAIPVSFDVQ